MMRSCGDDDLLEALFRHLLTWAADGAAAQVERTTAHLLAAFVDGQSATNRIPADVAPPAVDQALSYIYARLDREPEAAIRLDDLAAVAGVNRAHLCRIFRATTGRTPLETVRLARLDRAATLLARSNYTVAEIAAACGFASPFHFSRRFKESYGEAPRTLRDRLRAGEVPAAAAGEIGPVAAAEEGGGDPRGSTRDQFRACFRQFGLWPSRRTFGIVSGTRAGVTEPATG